MTVPTVSSLQHSSRRLDRRLCDAERVVLAMKTGASLHLHYQNGRALWSLSNGPFVAADVAAIVINKPSVVSVGDALSTGCRGRPGALLNRGRKTYDRQTRTTGGDTWQLVHPEARCLRSGKIQVESSTDHPGWRRCKPRCHTVASPMPRISCGCTLTMLTGRLNCASSTSDQGPEKRHAPPDRRGPGPAVLPSAKVLQFRLVLAAKPNDVFFLCHVPTRNLDNAWNSSNLQACEQARRLWTQATSRKEEGVEAYKIDASHDVDAFPTPTGQRSR